MTDVLGTARKMARTGQTYFPALVDHKFALQRRWRRVARRPNYADYRALALFAGTGHSQWVDIGANRGQTIDAMRMFSTTIPIVAFEPSVGLAGRLDDLHRSDPLVTVHAVALGDSEDLLTLYTPSYRGFVFDGVASMHREEAGDWLRSRLFRFDPSRLVVHEQQVPVRRLDEYDLAPTFIKLRVQGFELPVLTGGAATIAAHRPAVLVQNYEDGEGDVASYLAEFGYERFAYDVDRGVFVAGSRGGANSFFLTLDRQKDLPTVTG